MHFKLIQNEAEKQKVLAAFRRYRSSSKKSDRDLLMEGPHAQAIAGTGYQITWRSGAPIRYYAVNGVLCHEEYGPLDGDNLPWMQAEEVPA